MRRERELADTERRVIEEDARASRSILQQLYASEINVEVTTFWDYGFRVKLGDRLNGYKAEANLKTWPEVVAWLIEQAVIYFPDSRFAREHGAVPAPSVTPLHPERRKGANADPSNVTVICSKADRLVRDMGCEPDKPA